jgi:hypothetical protein
MLNITDVHIIKAEGIDPIPYNCVSSSALIW